MSELSFRLDVRTPERRRILVTLEVECEALADPARGTPAAQDFFLPTWTPGSYLIREYSRHLGAVEARDAMTGQRLQCNKLAKNRYRVGLPRGLRRLRVDYWVYAHELTVRTADVTPEHAFWNHACVLLWPVGWRENPARITVLFPTGWDLASSLPRLEHNKGEVVLMAANLDTAIDAPCLAGKFTRMDWRIRGVPHSVVLDGLGAIRPPAGFLDDLTRVIECAADVFGGTFPYSNYLFLCLFSDSGHGGLEHAESATLLSARTAMRPGKGYQDLLGLAAHEHFHAWNVKRMRPEEFWHYDYEGENYTPMLWLAEGFTSYYDDLLCRRAGVVTIEEYLAIVAKNLTSLWAGVGRFRQSLAEASFDAWIRFYRPDENTKNSTQNYYANGSLAALVLDLTIRRTTAGQRSLDNALQSLYQNTYLAGRGYNRDDVLRCLSATAGVDLDATLAALVDGPLDFDFAGLLADFGVALNHNDRDRPYLGLSFEAGESVVSSVSEGGPAFASGIAPGDEILAIEGIRVTAERWAEVFQATAVIDKTLRILTATRGAIVERSLTPSQPPFGTVALEVKRNASAEHAALRQGWLGTDDNAAAATS